MFGGIGFAFLREYLDNTFEISDGIDMITSENRPRNWSNQPPLIAAMNSGSALSRAMIISITLSGSAYGDGLGTGV